MTSEQFNKQSCEIIERIQDLEIEKILLEYALKGLQEEYQKQQVNVLKANVDYLNKKMAGRSQ